MVTNSETERSSDTRGTGVCRFRRLRTLALLFGWTTRVQWRAPITRQWHGDFTSTPRSENVSIRECLDLAACLRLGCATRCSASSYAMLCSFLVAIAAAEPAPRLLFGAAGAWDADLRAAVAMRGRKAAEKRLGVAASCWLGRGRGRGAVRCFRLFMVYLRTFYVIRSVFWCKTQSISLRS